MTAIVARDAEALLRTSKSPLARRALRFLANGTKPHGGVIPIDDALRTYERRLKWARDNDIPISGASKLLTRLRTSGLSHVAVFSTDGGDLNIVFFADPECETLLATIGVPSDEAALKDA